MWGRRDIARGLEKIEFDEKNLDLEIIPLLLYVWIIFLDRRHNDAFGSCWEWNASRSNVDHSHLGRRGSLWD